MTGPTEFLFHRRKRHLPHTDLFHGPQRKRRLHPDAVPSCFLVHPPETASAYFDMWDFLRGLPGFMRRDGGLGLFRRWVGRSQDPQDIRLVTRDDPELGNVVVSHRIVDPRKVALKAAPPPKPYYKEALERARRNDKRLDDISVEVRCEEERLLEQRKPADAPEEDLYGELFVPLTQEEESEVQECLYGSGSSSKVLVLHKSANIEVSREKFRCLRPHGWLNDEVINLYLELLKERGMREPKKFLKCHFFNTFFYKKLVCGKNGYDYKSVKRWTTSRKLGYELSECDKIFVPVHKDIHWCLAIINIKEKTFQYLDSLGGNDPHVQRALARYIVDEVKDKSDKELDRSCWKEDLVDYIPLQQNGYDCGMFMLKYIDFHSRGLSLSFGQEHMEYFRKRTVKEILRLKAD